MTMPGSAFLLEKNSRSYIPFVSKRCFGYICPEPYIALCSTIYESYAVSYPPVSYPYDVVKVIPTKAI
jgi:hypothetical protein